MKYVRYHEKSAARVERKNIKEIDVFKIILSDCTLYLLMVYVESMVICLFS